MRHIDNDVLRYQQYADYEAEQLALASPSEKPKRLLRQQCAEFVLAALQQYEKAITELPDDGT